MSEDDHSHDHSHAHGHQHDHDSDGSSPFLPSFELPEGAGRGKQLFLDLKSGVAGDMSIAALLDLGVPLRVLEGALSSFPIGGYHLHVSQTTVNAIAAVSFDVHVDGAQPSRNYPEISRMIAQSSLSAQAKDLAIAIFLRLAEAESFAHRVPIEDVHFHEVGAVDAIVDIVGVAAMLSYLGADLITASPLPMGGGFVRAAHGVLFNPPPAVVHCLRGCPTYEVALDVELVTPTGAAIVATVAERFERWPAFAPERVGCGAGTRRLADRPNVVRAVLGSPSRPGAAASEDDPAPYSMLEANVDDLTGEHAAHAIARALAAGALDAWASPIIMKKGRPGLLLSVLCDASRADALTSLLFAESTTLGVRQRPVRRTERPRRQISVQTPFGEVRCKVAEGPFGPALVKPEFDDCARLSQAAGVSLREVLLAAEAAARLALESG